MKTATITLVILMSTAILQTPSRAQLKLTSLKCEFLTDPLSVDVANPRLSWTIESRDRGVAQTAYEVLVSSSKELLDKETGDLWQTGKVASDRSIHVMYSGKALASRTICYWKVRIWDNHGNASAYSRAAMWKMGLLSKTDWKAQWIGLPADTSLELRPAPYVRKEFGVTRAVRQAQLYVTARGLFIASLNGRRIGNETLSPEWTDYSKRIQYLTYDVTNQVKEGTNCIGMIIGDGWFRGFVGFSKIPNNYGKQTSALLQLHIEYADGTDQIVCTDASWKGTYGPLAYSDLLMGERYDARNEPEGWNSSGFKDNQWQNVLVLPAPSAPLVALTTEPVRIAHILKPKKVTQPKKGTFVFDLGQNIAGYCLLKVKGPAGTEVTLRHAEVLNPDGTIYTENLRRAKATDVYVLKGGREEVFEPHFTFHGFRYVEVTGYPGKPSISALRGCAINTDLPTAGSFTCSDPIINQLQSNILWSQRGNFISIPTDCPQRDERLGWMGDAQIFVRTASFNMDVASFMTKWMNDVEDAQSPQGAFKDTSPYIQGNGTDGAPGWGDAGVIVPWYMYRCYGDTRIIEGHYEAMNRWMKYLADSNADHIRNTLRNNDYGDWLSIDAETPKDLLATAFWAYDAKLMSDMAGAIGRSDDQRKHLELFNVIKGAFQKKYIGAEGNVFGETQTGYVLSLAFDLIPDNLRERAVQLLVDDIKKKNGHLSTGFIGVKYLNPVLSDNGHLDLAYRLLFNKTFPSWGYPILNGATTIWERWDGWTKEKGFQDAGMNSFNHYSMGSVGEWLFRYVAGIDLHPDAVAYKKMIIHPRPNRGLKFANAEYVSIYGLIRSGWKLTARKINLDVVIPANATSIVYVPTSNPKSVRETGSTKVSEVKFLREEAGCAVFEIGSGTYKFEADWK
ncbi:MAG: family 78 glycoside hydrolase catalytic domain [Ignavibacteriales bacterium]|nr:family 78 glycoside hydrolase catalytic domain [Ignavibacteriales bacterium]